MSPPPPQIILIHLVSASYVVHVLSFLRLRAHEASVLTHELADVDRMDCYLGETLYPLTPLLVFGRSSKTFPAEKNDNVVFEWWQGRCLKVILR